MLAPEYSVELIHNRYPVSLRKPLKLHKFEFWVGQEDSRIRKGIAWLKTHQRASGRWFTRSMTQDNTHLITNSGTAYGILALALCGESESLDEIRQ